VRNRGAAQTLSQLDVVSNATTATLSLLRRFQALAQVHSAENRLLAVMGMDPKIGNVDELTVAELAEQLRRQFDALGGPLPAVAASAPAPAPTPASAPAVTPRQATAPAPTAAVPQAVTAIPVPTSGATAGGASGTGAGSGTGAAGAASGALASRPSTTGGSSGGATAPASGSTGPGDAASAASRVRAVVQGWAQAWSARDMDAYVAFYAPDFKGTFKTRDDWLKSRQGRIVTREVVAVDLSDVDVVVEGKRASATFRQKYRSNVMRDDTQRSLEFRDVGGRWLISGESGR
jgi:ketosteroid isomerase-like protein